MITSLDAAVDQVLARAQNQTLRIATPLGLGKPNQLINALYRRLKAQSTRHLEIYTALSLDPPVAKGDIESRFLQPFVNRIFGPDYPVLEYVRDLKSQTLPPHIRVHEFYVEAGAYKSNPIMQADYASINYTQVVRNLVAAEVEMVLLLISQRGDRYSLSCNPDLTLDLVDEMKAAGRDFKVVGVVHPDLPFISGDAEVPADFFQLIVQSPEVNHQLFAVPRAAIDATDFLIGLHASRIVPDGGTLQIGIGSLSDAVVYSLIQRHSHNAVYKELIADLPGFGEYHLEPFVEGLYGTSEMVMDGFMHLRKAGILKRTVPHGDRSYYLEGAFYLGSAEFYAWLRSLEGSDFDGFSMTRVSRTNSLFDRHDQSLRADRPHARFFNTCMNVTLLGGAASETLLDGRIVSGVGGQYNFVAMAHELKDAHSVLMLRSTSFREGRMRSNIIPAHGHLTIPRHLRDVVITEYGVAFLRGKTDADVIKSLIAIADSRFQEELLKAARDAFKIPAHFKLPDAVRNNTPASVKKRVADYRQRYALFPEYPFGSDFTPEELRLAKALLLLKKSSLAGKAGHLLRGFGRRPETFAAELQRMNLGNPSPIRDRLLARLLMGSLAKLLQ